MAKSTGLQLDRDVARECWERAVKEVEECAEDLTKKLVYNENRGNPRNIIAARARIHKNLTRAIRREGGLFGEWRKLFPTED